MQAMRGAVRRSGTHSRGTFAVCPRTYAGAGFDLRATAQGFRVVAAQGGRRTVGPSQEVALPRGGA